MIKLLSIISFALLLSACTDAEQAQWSSLGSRFHVTLYSASGSIIKEWNSNGKVLTEHGSDGWYFKDAANGKLVRVSGTVVVDQVD
jgi:hypothetical protein